MAEEKKIIGDFSELGATGLNYSHGYVHEEFLPALRGANARKIYKEMYYNDPTIGAIFFAAEQICRRAKWRIEPAGSSNVDKQAAQFLDECLHDMSTTWQDTLTEILTMLPYGWSWHEIVYKRRLGPNKGPKGRSQYNDGRIGWRRIPGRSQDTLWEWEFDKNNDGGIKAMIQMAPPDYSMRRIPIEKSLLFRTKANRNNPEGASLLRNAYRPWYFKKHIEEIEGIGIERDLAGLPMLEPPPGVDIWNEKDPESVRIRQYAEKLVRNVRRDKNEGLVIPNGWKFTLLSTGSRRQFDTNAILNRYDQRIAITVLADMVLLGSEKVGSFALAEVKKSLFAAAIEAMLDMIADIFNRHAVPRLFALNSFVGISKLPRVVHGEVETPGLPELSQYISSLTGAGAKLFPDLGLENYFRGLVGMPDKSQEQHDLEMQEKDDQKAKDKVTEAAAIEASRQNALNGGNPPTGDELDDPDGKNGGEKNE